VYLSNGLFTLSAGVLSKRICFEPLLMAMHFRTAAIPYPLLPHSVHVDLCVLGAWPSYWTLPRRILAELVVPLYFSEGADEASPTKGPLKYATALATDRLVIMSTAQCPQRNGVCRKKRRRAAVLFALCRSHHLTRVQVSHLCETAFWILAPSLYTSDAVDSSGVSCFLNRGNKFATGVR